MKFFLDTASISEITSLNKTGMVDGITTNPSLVAKTGQSFLDIIADICKLIDARVPRDVINENELVITKDEPLNDINCDLLRNAHNIYFSSTCFSSR